MINLNINLNINYISKILIYLLLKMNLCYYILELKIKVS